MLAIWEGTTNVLSLDVLRAEAREGAFSALISDLSARAERAYAHVDPGDLASIRAGVAGLIGQVRSAMSRGEAATQAAARRIALGTGYLTEALLLAEAAEAEPRAAEHLARFVALRVRGPFAARPADAAP